MFSKRLRQGGLFTALAVIGPLGAQTARPAFEVASVKVNAHCPATRGIGAAPTPGRLTWSCVSLRRLISMAYGGFADGAIRPIRPEVLGGDPWVDSELYDIEAKAGSPASFDQVYGVMLQVLLEDRFQVEVRRELREMPAYLLTIAKGGSKLQAAKDGACVPENPYDGPPRFGPREPYRCGSPRERSNADGLTDEGYSVSIADIAGKMLARHVDRPIIDRTGLTGKFDVRLSFVPTLVPQGPVRLNGEDVGILPPPKDDAPLTVFTALEQQLGLKLVPGKGPVEFLIIAHAAKPSAN